MSPYDDPQYNVYHMMGPILASYASGVKSTANNKTVTSVNVGNKIEFFRNVKLTGIKAVMRASGAATGKALTQLSPKVILTEGTRVCATVPLGTVAGVGTSGGVSATYATILATEEMTPKLKYTAYGTARTSDNISANIFIEYQDTMV